MTRFVLFRFMMKCASQAADEALRVMSCFPFPIHKSGVASICTICKMEYSKYRQVSIHKTYSVEGKMLMFDFTLNLLASFLFCGDISCF